MRKNCAMLLAVVAAIVVVGVAGYFLVRTMPPAEDIPGTPNTPTTGSALNSTAGKPRPVVDYFKGCPPSGDGGDPVLNTLKNRIDEAQWQPVTVSSLLSLTWPSAIEQKPRSKWSAQSKAEIARNEGTPVQVEGYLASVKKMSPETCNCHSVTYVDFHIWLVDDPSKDRTQAIVIETTPRVSDYHSEWTLAKLRDISNRKQKVRISGWLLMDPEHPDQIGKTRGSIWEIHPVMQIETLTLGRWTPLDNGTTGINSAPAAAQTVPPFTPVETATMPAPGDTTVQDNTQVHITNIFFDGIKSSAEPDEYVEITNGGNEPVDMTDWELQDTTGNMEYKWESFTIRPGQKIRVYTNEVHSQTGGFTFGSGRSIWSNSGDAAELYDADKQLISRYAYGNKR